MFKPLGTFALLLALTTTQSLASDQPFGCYVTNYDSAHLAKHKGQTITSMSLKLYSGKEVEGFTAYMFADISVKLRGDKTNIWSEVADCSGKPGAWKCGIECDGGGFALKEDGTNIVLTNSSYFRVTKDGCGETSHHIEAKPGNRMFKLSKSKLSNCK